MKGYEYMFTKRNVKKSKETVQLIMNNNTLSPKEKGQQLLDEFGKLAEWTFKDTEYENEFMELIRKFLVENNLKLKDYL